MTDPTRHLREQALRDGTWADQDSLGSWRAAIEEIGRQVKEGTPIPETSAYFRGWKR